MKSQSKTDNAAGLFAELRRIIARLRGPEGCPWDREQNFASMKSQFLEEVYEYVDALEEDEDPAMAEELGDLFFHLLFFAQLAEDGERFSLEAVLTQIRDKLIRRHPHVFGTAAVADSGAVKEQWEKNQARG